LKINQQKMIPDMVAQGDMRIAIEGRDDDTGAEVEMRETGASVTVHATEVGTGLIMKRGSLARIEAEVEAGTEIGTGEKRDIEKEAGTGTGTGVGIGSQQGHIENDGVATAPESHVDRVAQS
jgi:hypothetical protein